MTTLSDHPLKASPIYRSAPWGSKISSLSESSGRSHPETKSPLFQTSSNRESTVEIDHQRSVGVQESRFGYSQLAGPGRVIRHGRSPASSLASQTICSGAMERFGPRPHPLRTPNTVKVTQRMSRHRRNFANIFIILRNCGPVGIFAKPSASKQPIESAGAGCTATGEKRVAFDKKTIEPVRLSAENVAKDPNQLVHF